jgi:FtsP/CotA-like multicopper oxidase with cupredoxin domain
MLQLSILGSAALMLPLERVARTARGRPLEVLPAPFKATLPIPPVLEPVRRSADTDFYEITAREAIARILPGLETPIWGYNGLFPGPTLRIRSGRKFVVRHRNALPVPTSVHTHGAYVDGDSDGHPADLIQPLAFKDYFFDKNEGARTIWYHDHAEHITAINVYRGLAGFMMFEDDFADGLNLPGGRYDVPLVIQDRAFNSDGSLDYTEEGDSSSNGFLGDVILVNGKPQPRMEVERRKYRFRILNGSNARAYELALSTRQPLVQIATEGTIVEAPRQLRTLPIVPAERYEVVIDFSAYPVGTEIILKNRLGKNNTANVMRFDVTGNAKDTSSLPAVLRPPEEQIDSTHAAPMTPPPGTLTRSFRFRRHGGEWTINKKTWDAGRIDERPREGDTEIWEFTNNAGGWTHPVHVHLTNFRVLDRNGKPPKLHEVGFKETVNVGRNETVRVLMKWPKVPVGPQPGEFVRRYPFHCHNLEHEDHDMMLQFKVDKKAG